jgi:hypothetical protein
MCKTWTQLDYREDAAHDSRVVITDYVNDNDDTAIMVRDYDGDYTNVYDTGGEDNQSFWFKAPTEEDQKVLAVKAMAERGFRSADPNATQPLRGTASVQPVDANIPTEIIVEGKTLLEWKQAGVENEEREVHVHPNGDVVNRDNFMAFIASCSKDEFEAFVGMFTLSMNLMGAL